MFSISKTTGHLFDGLYLAVQTFSNGVGDTMFKVSQIIREVAFKGFSRFDHGFKLTRRSPETLTFIVFLSILRVPVIPKMPQRFFECPSPAGFQFHLPDFIKFSLSPIWSLFFVHKPKMLRSLAAESSTTFVTLQGSVRLLPQSGRTAGGASFPRR